MEATTKRNEISLLICYLLICYSTCYTCSPFHIPMRYPRFYSRDQVKSKLHRIMSSSRYNRDMEKIYIYTNDLTMRKMLKVASI